MTETTDKPRTLEEMRAFVALGHTDAEVNLMIRDTLADQCVSDIKGEVLELALALGKAMNHARLLLWSIDAAYRGGGDDEEAKTERYAARDRLAAAVGELLGIAVVAIEEVEIGHGHGKVSDE